MVSHFRPGAHTYWIALTVSLVVLRDEAAAPMRALERGLGVDYLPWQVWSSRHR